MNKASKTMMLCVALIQTLASNAWAREPADWLRVEGMPGVRLSLEHGTTGPERAILRVGEVEQVFRIETLPAGTRLYHWGQAEDLASWIQEGAVPPETLAAIIAHGGYTVPGLYASLHPWDSVNYGHHLMQIELQEPAAMLVAQDAPLEKRGDPLSQLMETSTNSSSTHWTELFHKAGLSGIFMGSVPAQATQPGYRWTALTDAAALQHVHLASSSEVLEHLATAPWNRLHDGELPVALVEFLAVGRAEAYDVTSEAIRAALPQDIYQWFIAALDAPEPLSDSRRAALWEAVPAGPARWEAWGMSPRRTLCTFAQDPNVLDLQAADLCQRFIAKMCTPSDLQPLEVDDE